MRTFVLFVSLCLLAPVASAKQDHTCQGGKNCNTTSEETESHANAFSAAASKSRSNADADASIRNSGNSSSSSEGGDAEQSQGQSQGQAQKQTSVGSVDTEYEYTDNSEYAVAASSAASLPSGYCTRGGLSGQWISGGVSATTGTDPVCARIELARAYLQVGSETAVLRTLISASELGAKGKPHHLTVADDQIKALVAKLNSAAREQLDKAAGEIDDRETGFRGFLRRLPVFYVFVP